MKTMLHKGISLLLCAVLLLQMVPTVSVHVHAAEGELVFSPVENNATLVEGMHYLLVAKMEITSGDEQKTAYYVVDNSGIGYALDCTGSYKPATGQIALTEEQARATVVTCRKMELESGESRTYLVFELDTGGPILVIDAQGVRSEDIATAANYPSMQWDATKNRLLCGAYYLNMELESGSMDSVKVFGSLEAGGSDYQLYSYCAHENKTFMEQTATCTSAGMAAHWECLTCGRLYLDETCLSETTAEDLQMERAEHTFEASPSGPAAEYVNEQYHEQACAVCGEPVQQEHQLRYSSDELYHFGLCTKCGAEVGRERHDFIMNEEELDGRPSYCEAIVPLILTCSRQECGQRLEVTLPAVRHSWSQWYTVSEATEQEPGEQIRYCLVCSDGIEYRTIPAKNHEHQLPLTPVAKVDATCTTAGTEAHYICDANGTSEATSGCGCMYLDDQGKQQIADSDLWIAPTIEHNWGDDWAYPQDGDQNYEPTETTHGLLRRTCEDCGETQEMAEKSTSHVHQLQEVAAKDATCVAPGNIKYYICDFEAQYDDSGAVIDYACANMYSGPEGTDDQLLEPGKEEIPATGHSMSAWEARDEGHTRYCTNNCGYTETANHVTSPYAENGDDPEVCQLICLACSAAVESGKGHEKGECTPCTQQEDCHTFTCGQCGGTFTEPHTDWVLSADGSGAHTCGYCGYSTTEHIMVKNDTYTAPTCTTDGEQGYSCAAQGCNEIQTVILPAGHVDENGDYHCDTCGENICESHEPKVIPGEPATCTKDGKTDGSVCAKCGLELTPQAIIVSEGHKDEDGDYICDVCLVNLCFDKHVEETVPAVPATCAKPGLTEGIICANCGIVLRAQEEIEKLSHTIETIEAEEPTCTKSGKTGGKGCKTCGLTLILSTEWPATGHRWSEWYAVKEATHTQSGQMMRHCLEGCGATEKAPCPAGGHEHPQLKWVEEIPATCNQQGRKGYWYCMDVTTSSQEADEADFAQGCKAMFLDAEGTRQVTENDLIIPATGEHKMGDWVVSHENDPEFIMYERTCTCGHIEYRPEPRETHVHTLVYQAAAEASCTANGAVERYVCTGCPCLFADADGKVRMEEAQQAIPNLGHAYGKWVETDAGHQRECERCRKIETRGDHLLSPLPGDPSGETCSRACLLCGYHTVSNGHQYTGIAACDDRWQHQQSCQQCGFALVEDHEFGPWQYGKFTHENTEESITGHFRSCQCGTMETSVEHLWDEGKELKPGFVTYTCMVEGCKAEKVDFLRCMHTCADCGLCTAETPCPDQEPCECAQPEPLKTTEPTFLTNNTADPNQTYLGDILAKKENDALKPDAKPGQQIPAQYVGFTVGIQEVPLSDAETGEAISNPYTDYVEQALTGYSTKHLFDIHLLDDEGKVTESTGDAQYLIRLCLEKETVLALQKGLLRLAHITENGTTFYGVDDRCTAFYKLEGTQAWFWADRFSPFALVEPEAPYFGREALATLANKDALLYAYDQIVMGVEACLDKITIYPAWKAPSLTIAELQMVMDAYTRDHTENFWLGTKYSISYKKSSGLATAVKPQYTMSGATLTTARANFNAEVEEILHGITPEMSEFDRQLLVHDRLAAQVTYDGSLPNAHDAYGALIDGKAVCQGYAEAFQYLLRRVGIQSFIVTGTGVTDQGEIPHAWNMVRIDGDFYHTDLTWDDTGDKPYHAYFNMNDHFITEDHVIAVTAYPMEECVELEANYFTKKQTDLSDSQAQNVDVVANKLSGAINGVSFMLTEDTSPLAFLTWFGAQKTMIFSGANLVNVSQIKYTYNGREAMISFEAENGQPPHICGGGTEMEGQPATCTTPGWAKYYQCSCKKLFKEAACINEITNLAAWKMSEGKTTAGHSYGSLQSGQDAIHNSSQLQDGMASYYQCAHCGEYFTEGMLPTTWNSLILKAAHQYGDWVTDASGHRRSCTCGHTADDGAHTYLDQYDVNCDTCAYERAVALPEIAVIRPEVNPETGKLTVTLIGADPISGKMMVAVYDLNDRMLGISYVDKTLNVDKMGKTFTIVYDKKGTPRKVKAFVMDNSFAPTMVIDPIELP